MPDNSYQEALQYLQASSVPLEEAVANCQRLPLLQTRPPEEYDPILSLISAADQIAPQLRADIISSMQRGAEGNLFGQLDNLILSATGADETEVRAKQIALTAGISCLFVELLQAAPEGDQRQQLFQPLAFYAAVHELMAGAPTNFSLFLENPERPLQLLDTTRFMVIGPENLQPMFGKLLMSGASVSLPQDVGDGRQFMTMW